eukprot:UN09154
MEWQQTIYYMQLTAGLFCFLISMTLTIYYMSDSRIYSSSIQIGIFSLSAIVLYSMTCFLGAYTMSLFDADQQPTNTKQWVAALGSVALWRVAQTLTYLIFIQRLKQAFKNTKYASHSF